MNVLDDELKDRNKEERKVVRVGNWRRKTFKMILFQ
jgi:hypothetical protein